MNKFKGVNTEEGVLCKDDYIKYQSALAEVKMYLDAMLTYFFRNRSEGFITSWRLKDTKSISGKIRKKKILKGSKFNLKKDITDISGIRVVISDKTDYNKKLSHGLNYMDHLIHNWNFFEFKENFDNIISKYDESYLEIIEDFIGFLVSDSRYGDRIVVLDNKNYMKHPKESGYQSIHILIYATNGYPVEIQFRNLAQHYFAEFEHEARYKAKKNTSYE